MVFARRLRARRTLGYFASFHRQTTNCWTTISTITNREQLMYGSNPSMVLGKCSIRHHPSRKIPDFIKIIIRQYGTWMESLSVGLHVCSFNIYDCRNILWFSNVLRLKPFYSILHFSFFILSFVDLAEFPQFHRTTLDHRLRCFCLIYLLIVACFLTTRYSGLLCLQLGWVCREFYIF